MSEDDHSKAIALTMVHSHCAGVVVVPQIYNGSVAFPETPEALMIILTGCYGSD